MTHTVTPRCLTLAACGLFMLTVTGRDVSAQQGAARDPGVLTLPAGEHELGALVDMIAQARKVEIHRDQLGDFEPGAVVVQRELRLDAVAFEDIAATMLYYQGFMIVPAAAAGEYRVVAVRNREELREAAVSRTPDEILARPSRVELVTTLLPAGDHWLFRLQALAPFLFCRNQPASVRFSVVDGEARLTGSTAEVAFALRVIDALDGGAPAAVPPIEWLGNDLLTWPGGTMSRERFLELFVDTLDANVIARTFSVELELDLGEPAQLPPAEWFARATQVLFAGHQGIATVCAPHRVFLVRAKYGPDYLELMCRAEFEPAGDDAQSTTLVQVVTTFEPRNVTPAAASQATRARRDELRGTCLAYMGGTRMLLYGRRDQVTAALALLRDIDTQ